MKESILFWPAKLEDGVLSILDETQVPHRIVYLKTRDYHGAIKAVVEMRTRAFGQFLTVCYAFMLEAWRSEGRTPEELLAHLKVVAEAFHASRPTFPFREVTGMVLKFAQKFAGSPRMKDEFLAAMQGFLEGGIRQQRYARARAAAALLKDGDSVLTHCHVSGEMALIAAFCSEAGKKVRFIATETRPYFQGSRLTAWELARGGFDVTLIPDNAVARVMAEGRVSCVIVGSDRSAANGDFANKIGTYQVALLARHYKIPFYVLDQPSQKLASGREIPIEVRDDSEVLTFEGHRLGDKRLKAYYPGFDIVPHAWVTQHISIHAN